jgi:hypothetical protein
VTTTAHREMVFRKPYLTAFSVAGAVFIVVIFAVAAFAIKQASIFWVALIFTGGAYFFWLLGWQSAVRVTTSGVIVDNLLVRHVVPWNALSEVGVRSGLAVRLKDGTIVTSLTFGGSLIGVMLGYRYTRGVAARIKEACARMQAEAPDLVPSAGYRYGFYATPWPLLVILTIMEVIAVIALFSK